MLGLRLKPVGFSDLTGFSAEPFDEVWRTFLASCDSIHRNAPELRRGAPQTAAQRAVCESALKLGRDPSPVAIRTFFESNFVPYLILPPSTTTEEKGSAFFTAYYRPEVLGSLVRTPEFTEPLLARPADLVTFSPGEEPSGFSGLSAARRLANGSMTPYPTRAEIESGAPGLHLRPIAYVADAIEAFMIHVQGSARLVLPDGRRINLVYAGRNGRPYTSIGKILTESGEIPLAHMSLDRLKEWVRMNGQDPGQRGRALLHRNESFVFFEATPENNVDLGPIGAAGLPLTDFRSMAVDRSIWPYGLPFWVDADIPWKGDQASRFARIMIAQDTGSAIVGAARADLYFGTGAEAGRLAGNIRHRGRMVVLLPSEAS